MPREGEAGHLRKARRIAAAGSAAPLGQTPAARTAPPGHALSRRALAAGRRRLRGGSNGRRSGNRTCTGILPSKHRTLSHVWIGLPSCIGSQPAIQAERRTPMPPQPKLRPFSRGCSAPQEPARSSPPAAVASARRRACPSSACCSSRLRPPVAPLHEQAEQHQRPCLVSCAAGGAKMQRSFEKPKAHQALEGRQPAAHRLRQQRLGGCAT
jgi:hypothetical protein